MNTEPQKDITPLAGNIPITSAEQVKTVITETVKSSQLKDELKERRIARKVFQTIIIEGMTNPTPDEIQQLVKKAIQGLI